MNAAKPVRHDHLATLDLLRLVAALAVLFFHFFFRGAAADGYLNEGYPAAESMAIYGSLGVRLFFIISGFVIAWSAVGRNWENFALARFVRLYPGFVICMTITFLVMLAAQTPVFPVSVAQYLANLTMFSPALGQPFMDGAYWSIVLEIIFYGWVTLALMAGIFERFKLELLTVWLILAILNEYWLGSGAIRILFITEYGAFFVAGILMHHIYAHGRSPEALLLLAAAFMISSSTIFAAQKVMLTDYGQQLPLAGALSANAFMHLLVIAAIRFRTMLRPSRWALALGGITYPLYLLHQHIGYVAINALTPVTGKWAAAALVMCALFAASWIVWRFAEKPLQAWLRPALSPLVARLAGTMRRSFADPAAAK